MMSGTSLDGVDAVLAEYHSNRTHHSQWQILAHAETEIPKKLKQTLYQLNFPRQMDNELHVAKVAEQQLTHCYAEAYQQLLSHSKMVPEHIDALAAHGQTIRHVPNDRFPYTLQVLNGALLSHLTQQTVVCDFRSKDLAAGGQGAPLAPLFHRELFPQQQNVAVVNIGGISNISVITEVNTQGFDCGPGNCLLDEWMATHNHQPYDKDGAWASQGKILPDVLSRLLNDHYFKRPPPKSTGRDYFNKHWLAAQLSQQENPVDVMRTLVRLTATVIADSVPDAIQTVILVGGGAKNALLLTEIATLLPAQQVYSSDELGIDSQQVEALGFAMLGKMTLLRQWVNTSKVTGAKEPVLLGAVYYA